MTEKQFEIFPQNVTKDGSLIIIQKGLKLYNIQESVDLLNELNEQLELFKGIFKNITQQLDIEIDSDDTAYKGTFIFTREEFRILKKLCKEGLKRND